MYAIIFYDGFTLEVADEVGKAVMDAIEMPTAPKSFKYQGSQYRLADVKRVINHDEYHDYKHYQQGKWKCDFGVFHTKYSRCYCSENMELYGDTGAYSRNKSRMTLSGKHVIDGVKSSEDLLKEIFDND